MKNINVYFIMLTISVLPLYSNENAKQINKNSINFSLIPVKNHLHKLDLDFKSRPKLTPGNVLRSIGIICIPIGSPFLGLGIGSLISALSPDSYFYNSTEFLNFGIAFTAMGAFLWILGPTLIITGFVLNATVKKKALTWKLKIEKERVRLFFQILI